MDKATNDLVEKFAGEAVAVLVREMEDQHKATWKYLSINKQPYSWEHMSAKRKAALEGVTSTKTKPRVSSGVLPPTSKNLVALILQVQLQLVTPKEMQYSTPNCFKQEFKATGSLS